MALRDLSYKKDSRQPDSLVKTVLPSQRPLGRGYFNETRQTGVTDTRTLIVAAWA